MKSTLALLAAVTTAAASLTISATPTSAATTTVSGIVFISDRDSPSADEVIDEVYFYDTATKVTSRLTNNTVTETFPVLSPDGRYLSYSTDGAIQVCPLTFASGTWSCGSARDVVTGVLTRSRFVWTPDGRSILYSANDPVGGDPDIFIVNLLDGSQPRNLTQEAKGEQALFDGQMAVSPDGRFFVYSRNSATGADLYRRRITGSNPVALTSTPMINEFGAAYSPDGQRIAFHSDRRSTADVDIFVMRAEPESATNVAVDLTRQVTAPDGTASRERFPTWSPDGQRIAFWWHVTPLGLEDGEIYTIAANGTNIQNITANNPADPEATPVGDIMPAWGRARA
jgi:Tol biopolymer transport system component